jgi:hypothetical protein
MDQDRVETVQPSTLFALEEGEDTTRSTTTRIHLLM